MTDDTKPGSPEFRHLPYMLRKSHSINIDMVIHSDYDTDSLKLGKD